MNLLVDRSPSWANSLFLNTQMINLPSQDIRPASWIMNFVYRLDEIRKYADEILCHAGVICWPATDGKKFFLYWCLERLIWPSLYMRFRVRDMSLGVIGRLGKINNKKLLYDSRLLTLNFSSWNLKYKIHSKTLARYIFEIRFDLLVKYMSLENSLYVLARDRTYMGKFAHCPW